MDFCSITLYSQRVKKFIVNAIGLLTVLAFLSVGLPPASAAESKTCFPVDGSYITSVPREKDGLACGFNSSDMGKDLEYNMNLAGIYTRISLEHPNDDKIYDTYQLYAKRIIASTILKIGVPLAYNPKDEGYGSDIIEKLNSTIAQLDSTNLTMQQFNAYYKVLAYHVAWAGKTKKWLGETYQFFKDGKEFEFPKGSFLASAKGMTDDYLDILIKSEGFANWVATTEIRGTFGQLLETISLGQVLAAPAPPVADDGLNHFGDAVRMGDYEVTISEPVDHNFDPATTGRDALQVFDVKVKNNSSSALVTDDVEFLGYSGEKYVWGETSVDSYTGLTMEAPDMPFIDSDYSSAQVISGGKEGGGFVVFDSVGVDNFRISMKLPDGTTAVWVSNDIPTPPVAGTVHHFGDTVKSGDYTIVMQSPDDMTFVYGGETSNINIFDVTFKNNSDTAFAMAMTKFRAYDLTTDGTEVPIDQWAVDLVDPTITAFVPNDQTLNPTISGKSSASGYVGFTSVDAENLHIEMTLEDGTSITWSE